MGLLLLLLLAADAPRAELLLRNGVVYTLDPARPKAEAVAIGEGRILQAGSKRADLTALSRDIMTVPEDEILKAEVVYTIVDGSVRYRR